MEEVWKKVYGSDDRYLISNHGRMRRMRDICDNPSDEIVKFIVKVGRYYINYRRNGVSRETPVANLVMIHFGVTNKILSKQPQVTHKDGDLKNCRIDNLEWRTSAFASKVDSSNANHICARYREKCFHSPTCESCKAQSKILRKALYDGDNDTVQHMRVNRIPCIVESA